MKPQIYCVDCVARLGLNKNKLIGRYDIFLLWYLGNYRDHLYLIFCGAGHKQTVNNFGKVQDRSKTFPHNFFLSHWHRMLVPRPSVVLSHIRLILSAPRVSNVCQPHQIFWISWSLGFLSSKDFLQFAENERWSVPFFLGASFEIVSITPASYIHNTHIYKHVFQIMSLLYVMYARCPHIIGIVMCPLHVFCHMPYFRLSYITGHVISTCLSWFMGLSRKVCNSVMKLCCPVFLAAP